jgi:hypothetical protein
LIIIHVLFNSPLRRQPSLAEAGFIEGFAIVPLVNSVIAPDPLGSTWKEAFVHMLTAPEQSEATIGPGGGGGGEPHGVQIMFANHPVEVPIKSEVKTSVKQPVVEVILPGSVVPVSVAKGVPVAVEPLYTSK